METCDECMAVTSARPTANFAGWATEHEPFCALARRLAREEQDKAEEEKREEERGE